jgi:hypothetical protein
MVFYLSSCPSEAIIHREERKMIQENEVVMAALGLGVSILVLVNRFPLKRIPLSGILIIGFFTLVAGWVLTVIEGFLWDALVNVGEHMCYAVGSTLVATWCWKVFGGAKESG